MGGRGRRAARSRPRVVPVSGLGGAARRIGRRGRWRIRAAQGRAVDTDGDAVMLQAIEQCVDQRLFVEQRVPVWQIEICSNDRGNPAVALIHQSEEGVYLFRL